MASGSTFAFLLDAGKARDAIKTLLEDDLPAQFDLIDTAYNDGVTLRDLEKIHMARMRAYPSYPCGVIFPSGQGGDQGQEAGFNLRKHPIHIEFYECTNEATSTLLPEELMQKRLERIVVAGMILLDANRDLSITGITKASIETIHPPVWFDFEPGPNDGLRRSVGLDLEVIVN